MSRDVPEADWKLFRELRAKALERFCERVLGEIGKLAAAADSSFHARYLEVYRQIDDRDKELARAFNDMRRSRMVEQLTLMCALGLIEDEELLKFSDHTQVVVGFLTGASES
jgi:hypothetical protein